MIPLEKLWKRSNFHSKFSNVGDMRALFGRYSVRWHTSVWTWSQNVSFFSQRALKKRPPPPSELYSRDHRTSWRSQNFDKIRFLIWSFQFLFKCKFTDLLGVAGSTRCIEKGSHHSEKLSRHHQRTPGSVSSWCRRSCVVTSPRPWVLGSMGSMSRWWTSCCWSGPGRTGSWERGRSTSWSPAPPRSPPLSVPLVWEGEAPGFVGMLS